MNKFTGKKLLYYCREIPVRLRQGTYILILPVQVTLNSFRNITTWNDSPGNVSLATTGVLKLTPLEDIEGKNKA